MIYNLSNIKNPKYAIITNMHDINELLPNGLQLDKTENGLILTDGKLSMKGDFSKMLPRIKQSNLEKELLIKAARIKNFSHNLTIIDATAGMGEDSFLLAAAGFNVYLFEQDPIIAALLEDSLFRASQDSALEPIVKRMTLIPSNSIDGIKSFTEKIDVIYLDPMFPERSKSGLIKKKFQLLQQLEKPCDDEHGLLNAAINAKPKKIIIKRPLKGPNLDGIKPDYSYLGKAIRIDVIAESLSRLA